VLRKYPELFGSQLPDLSANVNCKQRLMHAMRGLLNDKIVTTVLAVGERIGSDICDILAVVRKVDPEKEYRKDKFVYGEIEHLERALEKEKRRAAPSAATGKSKKKTKGPPAKRTSSSPADKPSSKPPSRKPSHAGGKPPNPNFSLGDDGDDDSRAPKSMERRRSSAASAVSFGSQSFGSQSFGGESAETGGGASRDSVDKDAAYLMLSQDDSAEVAELKKLIDGHSHTIDMLDNTVAQRNATIESLNATIERLEAENKKLKKYKEGMKQAIKKKKAKDAEKAKKAKTSDEVSV